MKRIVILTALAIGLCAALTGCPSSTTAKAAQALDIASASVAGFQQAEFTAHAQGLIPNDDHVFIEQSLLTLAQSGKAADACVKVAQTNAGIVTCVNLAITTVDNLNSEGALHLKSARAKSDYALAMTGVKTALSTITALLGGN